MRVMATGRSDYPNQINNVLAFPGVFRGALDARATAITEEMKLAAARGIASMRGRRRAATRTTSSRASSTATWRARLPSAVRAERSSAPRRRSTRRTADRRARRRELVRVAVSGATGTIGGALVDELRERGDEVTALSRDAERALASLGVPAERWAAPTEEPPPAAALRGRDAVVHLLGEPIAQRWSDEAKREIRDSRVLGTRNLVAGLRALPEAERPRVLVSQSGAGFYGARGDERLDESAPAGDDFVARMVVAWEAEASAAVRARPARGR